MRGGSEGRDSGLYLIDLFRRGYDSVDKRRKYFYVGIGFICDGVDFCASVKGLLISERVVGLLQFP